MQILIDVGPNIKELVYATGSLIVGLFVATVLLKLIFGSNS